MNFRVLLFIIGFLNCAGAGAVLSATNPSDLNSKGLKLAADGHIQEALPILDHAMKAAVKAYGDDDPGTDIIAYNYAKLLLVSGARATASPILQHMLDHYIKRYGKNDPRLAVIYLDLARVNQYSDADHAERLIHRATALYESDSHNKDPEYIRALALLGYVKLWHGNAHAAFRSLRHALGVSAERFGDDSEVTGEVLYRLGQYYFAIRKYKDAEKEYLRALEIFDRTVSKTNPNALATHAALVPVYEKLGKSDEATKHCVLLGKLAPDADGDVQPLYRIAPAYPFSAVATNSEGYVDLRFTITPEGRVENLKFVDGRRQSLFENAISKAVSQWRFKPRVIDGHPVASTSEMRFRFSIDK